MAIAKKTGKSKKSFVKRVQHAIFFLARICRLTVSILSMMSCQEDFRTAFSSLLSLGMASNFFLMSSAEYSSSFSPRPRFDRLRKSRLPMPDRPTDSLTHYKVRRLRLFAIVVKSDGPRLIGQARFTHASLFDTYDGET